MSIARRLFGPGHVSLYDDLGPYPLLLEGADTSAWAALSTRILAPLRALEGGVTFDGGSIDGFVRGEELDMVLRPDASTFAIYPWVSGDAVEARLICDIATPDGEPFEGCPRTTLKRVAETSADVAPDVAVALEVEFYLFERGAFENSTTTTDVGCISTLRRTIAARKRAAPLPQLWKAWVSR